MLQPRRWQSEALARWEAAGRGVVSVVTGGGKTALAIMAFTRLRDRDPAVRLVVVVPSIALLDQWVVALQSDGGLRADEIATFSGEGYAPHPLRANVLVINTARKLAATVASDRAILFVVDECHRAGSPENAKALDVAADYRLGLSATPIREFDEGFELFVEPALGPVVYEYDYVDAKRDGVISDFALHNFRFEMSATEQAEYDGLTRRVGRAVAQSSEGVEDARVRSLLLKRARLTADSSRRTAGSVAVSGRFEGRQLVFHERIEPATRIAELLDSAGDRVGLYHSGLGASIRRRNLELFKSGQFAKLVTCRALDEGLNVPNASVAVIAASTRSTRQRVQRLGRVLRTAPGKRFADVATLYATEVEAQNLRSEASTMGEIAEVHWYEISI